MRHVRLYDKKNKKTKKPVKIKSRSEQIKQRQKSFKIYTTSQLIGIEIGRILKNNTKTDLFIRLAQEKDPEWLQDTARATAQKPNIKNKTEYFLKITQSNKPKNKKTNR